MMWSASFYIIVCTAKNRLRARLARMREPRYLIGAAVAIVYLYFTLFRGGSDRGSVPLRRGEPGPERRRACWLRPAAPLRWQPARDCLY